MISLSAIWDQAQDSIKKKVGAPSYETWFSSLRISEKPPQTIVIQTPDEFFKGWFEEHYLSTIKETISTLSSDAITIEFEVQTGLLKKQTQQQFSQIEQSFQEPAPASRQHNLYSRFTFNNFVVGSSNRFAYAASLAVAESPAKAYNPLFIYGKVGLGKTHLMQAIAQEIQQRHPKIKLCYMSSEKFTNQLIDAIRNRSTKQFRQKYRHIDVLLIDDIHFIAGKESTQEEFFHTFNALHDSRKQIIISSDRPPKEINKLEDRLSSRFAWGLITDIQPPDFETRVAILRKKIEREPVNVPDDIIFFIAQEIKTNIRELEGALIRVIAYSLLEEKPISLSMAKTILKDMVKESVKIISVEMVQKTVSEFFGISLADLRTKRRNRNLVVPRQIAMYLSRKLTQMSFPEIGNAFGGKDHTTVLHSCRKIENNLADDAELKNVIEKLSTTIEQ